MSTQIGVPKYTYLQRFTYNNRSTWVNRRRLKPLSQKSFLVAGATNQLEMFAHSVPWYFLEH